MNITRRRGAIALAITLGVLIIGGLIAFYIPWVLLNERSIMLFVLGLILLGLLVAGVVLNTVFLVREVRRNERQDSFLNAVTHELKTPIASLRLYLETLQRREIPEPQRQDFYRIMLEDTGRLLSTVEQVLKAGELNARSRHQNRSLLEIEPIVSDCIAITRQRHHLPDEAIVLERVPGAVRLRVRGIAEDLRTAIVNVLDNAVKYSPNGVQVRCSLAIVNYASVRLSISDHGVGLPPGQDKRIFKRFYRVPGRMAVKIKGTGIGLFLVRTIVRQHGGEVKAASAGLNQGTTISILLPLASSLPAESILPAAQAEVQQ
jgi:two-component system, OmpR family, sensor histidine kinase SenX3